MNYLDLSIKDIHNAIVNGLVTPEELAKEALLRAHSSQPILNAFETIIDNWNEHVDLSKCDKENPLFGIPFALKDNFSTKNILTTASSNILKNYVPVFDSTVAAKLKAVGAINIGKTAMDELALGGTGLNGHLGMVHNPYGLKENRISGGSSAGSAVAVAAGIVPFAIGSDTGDSVRKPAAYNEIVGFKPTWGRISRFGLFPFAPSLDHVAFFTRTVKDSAYVLEALSGNDPKDMSSSLRPVEEYSKNLQPCVNGKCIGVIKEIDNSLSNPEVKANFESVVEKLKAAGANVKEFSIDKNLLKAILPAYLVISCSEATSNDANLVGIGFGPRENSATYIDSIIQTRTVGFSELLKRRFVIGSYSLAKENQEVLFLRAQKVRRMIVDRVTEILKECDVILFPASGDIAPKADDQSGQRLSSNHLIGENHLAIGNFGGFPSLTLPSGFVQNMPVGINVTGRIFEEQEVLNISAGIEEVLNISNVIKKVGE